MKEGPQYEIAGLLSFLCGLMVYLLKDELRNAFSLSVTTEGYEDRISASLRRLISVPKSFSIAFSFAVGNRLLVTISGNPTTRQKRQ